MAAARARNGARRFVVISETDRRDVRLDKQLRALEALGHDVRLVAPQGPQWEFGIVPNSAEGRPREVYGMWLDEAEPPAPTTRGLLRRVLPQPVRRLLASPIDLSRSRQRRRARTRKFVGARRLAEVLSADVIVLHRVGLAVDVLGRGPFDVPVIVDFHELPSALGGRRFQSSNERSPRYRRRRREARRILRALRRADLITAEELVARHLADEFGLPTAEMPNVMFPETVHPSDAAGATVAPLHERLKLLAEDRLTVFLGFYRPSRGIELLVEAFEQLPDHHHLALVVGWTGRDLREVVASSPAAARIHLTDLILQEEIVETLRGADVGVFLPVAPATHHEELCGPTKLFELHAAGVPLLIAGDEGLREFSDRSGGAVVLERPLGPSSIARAIEDVVEGRLSPPPRCPTPDLVETMHDALRMLDSLQTSR